MNEEFNSNNELTNKELGNNINNIDVEGEKKNNLLKFILIVGCIISFVFIVITILYKQKNIFQTENKIGNIIFKDISFLNIEKKDNDVEIYNDNLFYNNKFYDFDGKVVFDASEYDYIEFYDANGFFVDFYEEHDFIIICKDYSCGVMDNKFNIIVPVSNYDVDIESNNYIILRDYVKKTISIFDVKNNIMYEGFNKVKYINDNFILIKKNDNSVSNNQENGWEILSIAESNVDFKNQLDLYDLNSAVRFKNDYIIISKNVDGNELYGVIDSSFNEFVPFIYDDIDNVDDKYLLLTSKNSAKIISETKEEIINLENVNETLAFVADNSIEIVMANDPNKIYYKTFAYYDLNSKLLYEYSDVSETGYNVEYLSDNVYLFYNSNDCFYINSTENIKTTNKLFCNEYNRRANKYIIKEEAEGEILYNLDFNPIFKEHYDKIILYNNFCLVKIENKYYIYSFNEQKILEDSFDYYIEIGNSLILANEKQENEKYLKYYYFEYKK